MWPCPALFGCGRQGSEFGSLWEHSKCSNPLCRLSSAPLFFWETWSHYLALADLELVVILLSLSSKCWGNRLAHHCPWVKQLNVIRNVSPGTMDGGRIVSCSLAGCGHTTLGRAVCTDCYVQGNSGVVEWTLYITVCGGPSCEWAG